MWGIDNEERARLEYADQTVAHHKGFDIDITGLHVNPFSSSGCFTRWPYFMQLLWPRSARDKTPF